MKRAISASIKDPIDDCLELTKLITKCEDLCSYLEDAYFDEPVVDDFIKCWKGLQTAQRGASAALLKLTTKANLWD